MHQVDIQVGPTNRCPAFSQLVVINRGYEIFQLKKDITNGVLRCPCCRTSKFLNVRNCGFVNCEWSMRGILRSNKESKIYADGRTYDNKLYTFKECDYMSIWHTLDVMAKKLDPAQSIQNIDYPTSNDFKNKELRMRQKLLLQKSKSKSNEIEPSSQRQAYRSEERLGEKKADSEFDDSDDDLIDLAVLQNQAKNMNQNDQV